MKYYIVEIREPTNNPGDWVEKRVFTSLESAEDFISKTIKEDNDVEDVTDFNEWDDKGPNWKNIKTLRLDDCVISLDEVES